MQESYRVVRIDQDKVEELSELLNETMTKIGKVKTVADFLLLRDCVASNVKALKTITDNLVDPN